MLERFSVHPQVCKPIYGLPLYQSDRRILSLFKAIYTKGNYSIPSDCTYDLNTDPSHAQNMLASMNMRSDSNNMSQAEVDISKAFK